MRNLRILIVTAAVVLVTACTASVASARPAVDRAAPATPSAQLAVPVPSAPEVAGEGFRLGDAVVGAALMLAIVGVGVVAVTAVRHREHGPIAG